MLVSIKGKRIDYVGAGCYNFRIGHRVIEGHLHNDGANGIEYVNLEDTEYGPTHKIDLPNKFYYFMLGVIAGIVLGGIASLFYVFLAAYAGIV